jgi:hypothetical protein
VTLSKCHYCSHFRPEWRVHRLGVAAQTICDYCLEWHHRALDVLAGRAISGCQTCGASWETLRDRSPGVEVKLYVVPKDGIYQVLCADCIQPYTGARRDLYGGTAYGALLN